MRSGLQNCRVSSSKLIQLSRPSVVWGRRGYRFILSAGCQHCPIVAFIALPTPAHWPRSRRGGPTGPPAAGVGLLAPPAAGVGLLAPPAAEVGLLAPPAAGVGLLTPPAAGVAAVQTPDVIT